jgi:hypothetical protein
MMRTLYWPVCWLNILFAAQPFIFDVPATGFHIFNACVALLMIWAGPEIKQES